MAGPFHMKIDSCWDNKQKEGAKFQLKCGFLASIIFYSFILTGRVWECGFIVAIIFIYWPSKFIVETRKYSRKNKWKQ